MNTSTIEELAYLIKQAKEERLPQPIVFLGAGASKTGGVPLAYDIIKDILEKFKESPKIKFLKDEEKTYAKLMECLTPFERNKLLKGYIDCAKINVTHIYLAQLIVEGFVDYVLTVNFDNLMLRALALFNNFPATYDMAILKDLTTTSFKEKSVVYLHGQHHGLWLLNTQEEMAKVNEIIPPILNSIKDQRPWIFIGYSGEDPIFEHITKLGRFDNGLYWVTYNNNIPNELVCNKLLEKANTNTFLIKGYDSDSFILKLCSELKLPQPKIIDKPFSSLKHTLENIVDIDDKEHFKGVKERLEIVKKDVKLAIQQFELGKIDANKNLKQDIDIKLLKKQIIDVIIKEEFNQNEINLLDETISRLNDEEIKSSMANLYNSWGIQIKKLAKMKSDEVLYKESFEKYQKATELNPKYDSAFYNWGTTIYDLAKLKNDEVLYKESFEKYQKSTELNPKKDSTFYNWGIAIYELAKLKNDEVLYKESFEKYQKATELNPKKDSAFYNWGIAIHVLAKLKNDEGLYKESFEKYQKATELNPKKDSAFYNWGNAIMELAKLKNDEGLYKESFEKYQKTTELNPKDDSVFYNWGIAIYDLAKLKNNEALYKESFEKYQKATELNPKKDYAFYNWGIAIKELAKLKNDENLYKESFEKYQKATELNPKYDSAFYNWGYAIMELAKLKNDMIFFEQCFEKLNKAVELGGRSYNLACAYAVKKDKNKALEILENSLKKNEIETSFVERDDDWNTFLDDSDFIALMKKYNTGKVK